MVSEQQSTLRLTVYICKMSLLLELDESLDIGAEYGPVPRENRYWRVDEMIIGRIIRRKHFPTASSSPTNPGFTAFY